MTSPIYSVRAWRLFRHTIPTNPPSKLLPLATDKWDGAWGGPVSVSPNGVDAEGRGFWGLNSDRPREVIDFLVYDHNYNLHVLGVIEHRGTALEYEHGWRSDRAVIRRLLLFGGFSAKTDWLQTLGQFYDCHDVGVAPPLPIGTVEWCVQACCQWVQEQRERDKSLVLVPNAIDVNL